MARSRVTAQLLAVLVVLSVTAVPVTAPTGPAQESGGDATEATARVDSTRATCQARVRAAASDNRTRARSDGRQTGTTASVPDEAWNRTYGHGYETARALVQTADGGFVLAADSRLLRVGPDGAERWNRTYDIFDATGLVRTTDGGFVVVGEVPAEGDVGFSVGLLKVDGDGTKQWNRTYEFNNPHALVQTTDGGFAVVGRGGAESWLLKVGPDGAERWNRTYGGPRTNWLHDVVQTSDGGFALAGRTDSFDANHADVWLVRVGPDGTERWNRTYGGDGFDTASALVQTDDGGFALAGREDSFGSSGHGYWLLKVDAGGAEQWNRTYPVGPLDTARALVQTADGGFALAGERQRTSDHGHDAWLLKVDSDGTEQWNRTFGDSALHHGDSADALVQTADGGFALAGRTGTFESNTATAWLVKVESGAGPALDPAFQFSPERPEAGAAVTFDASASAPAGSIERYEWAFGDGTTASGPRVFHTYTTPGTYEVELTVTDARGRTATVTRQVEVDESTAPVVVESVDATIPGWTTLQGLPIRNTYTVTTDAERPIDHVTFALDGRTVTDADGSDGWQATLDLSRLRGDATLTVTAVDVDGNEATATRQIRVLSIPEWLRVTAKAGNVSYDSDGRIVVERTVPEPPIDAEVELPESLPVLGGDQAFRANATVRLVYRSTDGTAILFGEGMLHAEMLGRTGTGTIGVEGTIDTTRWTVVGGRVWVSLELETVSKEWPEMSVPVVDISPDAELAAGPTVRLEGRVAGTREGLKLTGGTLTLGGWATGLVTLEGDQTPGDLEVTVTVNGRITGSLDVPSPYDPRGTGSIQGTGTVQALIYETSFTVGPFEKQLRLAESGAAAATETTDWSVRERGDDVPLDDGPPHGGRLLAGGAGSRLAGLDAGAPDLAADRLTEDAVEDRSPAVAFTGDDHVVVWRRQDPAKSIEEGPDVYWSRYEDGDWAAPAPVSDDRKIQFSPAVASDGNGTAVAVWSVVDAVVPESNISAPGDAYPHVELAYAVFDGTGWSAPTVLTDDSVMDRNPEVAHVDGDWVLAWVEERDNNLSTTADRRVRVVRYDGTLTAGATPANATVTATTIANATSPRVAGGGRNATVAFFEPDDADAENGTVAVGTVDDGVTVERRFDATRFTDLAVAGDTVAWLDGPVTAPRLHVTRGANATRLGVERNVTGVRDLDLHAGDDVMVLTYRGRPADENGTALFYRLRRDGEWLADRRLADGRAAGLTFRQPSTAVGGDGFRSVFAGENASADQEPDLFSVDHAFRGDLAVRASANATRPDVGDVVRIDYTVENRGDVAVSKRFGVVLANATGAPRARTTHGELPAGGTVNGSFVVPMDASGEVRVTVDPSGNVTELSERNNRTTLTLARPNLTVGVGSESRSGDVLRLTAVVENSGGVAAGNVSVRFYSGDRRLAAETVDAVAPNATERVTLTVNASAVNRSIPGRLVVDGGDAVAEADETNTTRYVSVLRPDLRVAPGAVTFYNDSGGVAAAVVVANGGTGHANATVTVRQGNETVARRTVTLPGAADANASTFRTVQLPMPGVDADETVVLSVAAPFEADPSDNAIRTAVAPVLAGPAPNVTSVTVSPASAAVNETVTANATVVNSGDVSGSVDVTLTVDGRPVENRSVRVAGGATTYETFDVTFATTGVHTVAVGGLAPRNVTVERQTGNDTAPRVRATGGVATSNCSPAMLPGTHRSPRR